MLNCRRSSSTLMLPWGHPKKYFSFPQELNIGKVPGSMVWKCRIFPSPQKGKPSQRRAAGQTRPTQIKETETGTCERLNIFG